MFLKCVNTGSKKINWNEYLGRKINRLTILDLYGKNKYGRPLFKCECNCGNIVVLECTVVKNGVTKSCGCLQREKTQKLTLTHGMTNSRLYRIWTAMKSRCNNPNNNRYYAYGARGITICSEWVGEQGFINFYDWAIKNGYDNGLTIERKNNYENYSPDNCRWATNVEQANNKRNNHLIEYDGCKKNVKQWANYFGFDYKYFHEKLKKNNWSINEVLEIPYFKEKINAARYSGERK